MPLVTGADERAITLALDGLTFPATKYDVLAFVTDRGDVGAHLLIALGELPERTFTSPADAVISIPDRRSSS